MTRWGVCGLVFMALGCVDPDVSAGYAVADGGALQYQVAAACLDRDRDEARLALSFVARERSTAPRISVEIVERLGGLALPLSTIDVDPLGGRLSVVGSSVEYPGSFEVRLDGEVVYPSASEALTSGQFTSLGTGGTGTTVLLNFRDGSTFRAEVSGVDD